ncbi:hypothetical protein IWW55_001651, partial [Coemansia sp. RSA 2706]
DSSSDAETSVSNDSSIDSNAESTSSAARGTDSFANFASAIYAPAQFAATPTSSEPRVLSVNVVLPTIAIKITDDPGAPDAATVITIGAATSTSTQLRAVPFFKGPDDGLAAESSSSAAAANVESQPASSPVRLGGPALSSRTRIPDELPSVSAQERRKITIDDKDLFSILYMSDIQPQNIESLSSPPASPMRALTPTPSSTVPAFTGSQPPGMPSPTIKGDTGLLRPSSSEPSLLMPEQMLQALPQAFATQSSLPQSAPVSSARVVQSLPLPTGVAVASAPNLKPPAPQTIVQPTLTQPPPSTLTLNPLPTPLPTPTNPPAALYSLPAPQGVPQSVLAPLITVILHPTFAPLPATAPSLVPVPPLSTMAPILPPLPRLPAPSRTSPKKDLLFANEQASGSLDPVYPQYTPIIPFISDGFRRPTPSLDDSDMLSKGVINAGGIASILQDVFHVPAEKITIDGKPVVINGPGHSGSGGISVVVMDPEDQKKGPSQHRGVKGAADDDDDDDDFMDDFGDDSDSETTTHSLNVDRAKHRNHAHAHAQAHARGRLEKSTLDSDAVNAKGAANDGYDSDGYSSDDSDGSDDSDDEGNGNIKTDEDTALGHATPTSTASSSAESESPTPTSRRRKHLHDLTDTGEPPTRSQD